MRKHLLPLVMVFMAGCASPHGPAANNVVDIDQANLPPGVQAPIAITPHTAFREDYPAESVQAHEVGAIRLHYMILENGTVGDIQILESSGFQRLDDASIAMVRNRWTFMPATRNGQPIRAWQRAKLVWQLNDVPAQT
jgi:TonB family protein